MPLTVVLFSAVGLLTALAAYTDLAQHRVPNWLTIPAVGLGLAFHGLAGAGWLAALEGLAIGVALLLLPALLGGSGMGDVKLLAALGTWLGPQSLLVTFGVSMVLAAVLSIAMLSWSALHMGLAKARGQFLGTGLATTTAPSLGRRVLPFAVPVAVATWLVLAWSLASAGV